MHSKKRCSSLKCYQNLHSRKSKCLNHLTFLYSYPKSSFTFKSPPSQTNDDNISWRTVLNIEGLPGFLRISNVNCVKSVQIRSYFWSLFSPNTGKHGPEIPPYLYTFQAVLTLDTALFEHECNP